VVVIDQVAKGLDYAVGHPLEVSQRAQTDKSGTAEGTGVVDRQQAIKVLVVAVFVGLLAGIGTLNVGYGLGAFVIVFLGFGGWEFLQGRR
jgi:hypothetical protein